MDNDKSRAGQLARLKLTFGERRRYAVAPVHTRYDAVEWFIWDAETDDNGLPAVIRQTTDPYFAIASIIDLGA